ncbi:VWA domain-containing protein [Fervidibacillus albus]|uniref:VWA domain-containing protein n=1 Tax=Fervidibacillus albus TaxID=2980026 RepID=A0A9E8LW80_9BACI|nr:VWA domain-containing protein [Fervidibacillus albus]WAA10686.1 VWA domain-containing protein [Fervidibacillus albus]
MVEMKYPFMFILLVPAFFHLYIFYKGSVGLSKRDRLTRVIFRGTIYFLLAFALTIPKIVIPVKTVDVVFLVDRSDSVAESEEDIVSFVNESIDKKQPEDKYAILSFGDQSEVEFPLRQRKEPFIPSSFEQRGNTNLEDGLYLASSLLENGGRIVVITDGIETEGNALEVARLLQERGIEVDYSLVEEKTVDEMALSLFSVSEWLYEGEQATLIVHIDSNTDGYANITLSINDREIIREQVYVKKGGNRFSFQYIVQETGLNVLKAEIGSDSDTFAQNNTLYAVTTVKGIPKLLLVEGETSPLYELLNESGFEVDSVSPEMLPDTLSGYVRYESIIFNNIPATVIPEHRMNFIEQSVREFGKGFVMIGGEYSFGLGGYFHTPIERLLPVEMEIKGSEQFPSLGVVIVLDRSSSMNGNKLILAKEAAARSVELLREKDYFGLIVFNHQPHLIIETSPIENREKTIEKIQSVSSDGGTEFYSALQIAIDQLASLDLQRKHIILITDGEAGTHGDYFSLIDRGKESHITLSTVAIGENTNRLLLEKLAEEGGGRFYHVRDETVIPSILSRETVMMTKTYIVDDPFYPTIYPINGWDQLFSESVPKMNAYVATTPKDRGTNPIVSDKGDPIVSEWMYGLGKTLAFTSDVTGIWSGEFAKWKDWPKFVNHLVSRSLPQFDQSPISFSIEKEGGEQIGRLKTSDRLFQMEASIISNDGEEMDEMVKLIALDEYELELPEKPGLYYLNVKQTFESGEVQTYQKGFSIPYSEEYLLQGANENVLQQIATLTGGKRLSVDDSPFRALNNRVVMRTPLTDWILLIVFFLLFFELMFRRFGFSFIAYGRGKRKKITELPESLWDNSKGGKRRERNPSRQLGKSTDHVYDEAGGIGKLTETKDEREPSRQEKMNRLLQAVTKKRTVMANVSLSSD